MRIVSVGVSVGKRAPDSYNYCSYKDRCEEWHTVQARVTGEVNPQDADYQENGDEAKNDGSNNTKGCPATRQQFSKKTYQCCNQYPDDQGT